MASQRGSCYEPSRAPARHHKSDVFLCPRRTAREATDPPRGAAPPRPRRGRPSLLERWVEGLQSTGNCEQNGLPTFLILWRWRAGERLAMAETAAKKGLTSDGAQSDAADEQRGRTSRSGKRRAQSDPVAASIQGQRTWSPRVRACAGAARCARTPDGEGARDQTRATGKSKN